MKAIERFKKVLSYNWYTQGFNAVPLFLNSAASSGLYMKKIVGFGYTRFLHHYKNGFGEMSYQAQDFKKIWQKIKKKIVKDPKYLTKTKKLYKKRLLPFLKLFRLIDKLNLKKIPDTELLELFKKSIYSLVEPVGIAHMLDAIGIEVERELRRQLANKISDKKKLNKDSSILTSPTKPSFLKKEELELQRISKLRGGNLQKALRRHTQKYYWIHNSYNGPRDLKFEFFQKKIKTLKRPKVNRPFAQTKKTLLKTLHLPRETFNLISLINFATIWQDERKANILKAVSYVGKITKEVSRRTKIPLNLLYYLTGKEILKVKSLNDIKNIKDILKERTRGIYTLMEGDEEIIISGKRHQILSKLQRKLASFDEKERDIHGSVANGGKASGRVIICKNLKDIKKVRRGDIIVTSMTRPEFMPALKKAAAVVTDEGGITCHAAIVSRELGIPCVIGTKIATKVLRNGDLVDVNANHGTVSTIK